MREVHVEHGYLDAVSELGGNAVSQIVRWAMLRRYALHGWRIDFLTTAVSYDLGRND